jgi:hypothetical protein
MALHKCADCGHDVSSSAQTCPNCGAPRKKKNVALGLLATAVIFVLFLAMLNFAGNRPEATTSSAYPAAAASSSDAAASTTAPPYSAYVPEPLPPAQPTVTDLCYEYRTQQRLDSIVRVIAKKNMYAARQIHGRNLGCTFFPDANVARFDLTISWESMGRTPYWLTGSMELGPSDWKWTPGSASPSLTKVNQDWDNTKFWGTLILGAAAIGIAASQSKSSEKPAPSRSGFALACFWNMTPYALSLHTRWNGESDWTLETVPAGNGIRSWRPASDTFFVHMDVALDERVDNRIFTLHGRRQPSDNPECKNGPNYEFSATDNFVRMDLR